MSDVINVNVLDVVKRLTAGYDILPKHLDILETLSCPERVIRHNHKRTDQLRLGTANGLLVIGLDSIDNEAECYYIHPTFNYNEKKDVIGPIVTDFTKHIIVVSNTIGKTESKIWKITITK